MVYFDYCIPLTSDFGSFVLLPVGCPDYHPSKGLGGVPGVSHVLLFLILSVVFEVAGQAESLLPSLLFLRGQSFQHGPETCVRPHEQMMFRLFQRVS